ncbi:hypothetical protein K461DRAFT_272350 [Myriangium duriaei CBS 260.36]|uniref:Uncharacterized protein n=1 Tax=Myriangium duriaei CBS 260.36 TaxID=1168546 RepID=A0A9P4ITP6_9PEZI|nr:hypothetical protein K461DRAFT_272350 [Myriangium duriaei CBS 260.36]
MGLLIIIPVLLHLVIAWMPERNHISRHAYPAKPVYPYSSRGATDNSGSDKHIQDPTWNSPDLTPSSRDVVSSIDNQIAPDCLIGAPVLIFGHHIVYQFSGNIAQVMVRTVTNILRRTHIINQPRNATLAKIERVLTRVTFIVIALALLLEEKEGTQRIDVGVDDGKQNKVKRRSLVADHPVNLVSWDLSDDEAHASGNIFDNRSIMSDDLRVQMVGEGHKNITFIHTSDTDTPMLAHDGDDGTSHFHWRPSYEIPLLPVRADQTFKHHYPYFNANGAGFKISATNPIGRKIPKMPMEQAKKMAGAIVRDLIERRGSTSCVGYEDVLQNNGLIGHRLCFIPEIRRFGLKDELNRCFANKYKLIKPIYQFRHPIHMARIHVACLDQG